MEACSGWFCRIVGSNNSSRLPHSSVISLSLPQSVCRDLDQPLLLCYKLVAIEEPNHSKLCMFSYKWQHVIVKKQVCCFFLQQSLSWHGSCVSEYFPFSMQEKILCWIHKLKSPCVGEELNGGAHSVNSCFGQKLSRQICCHMTLRRSDSGNNKQPAGNILSAEEWARDWRVGLEYCGGGGGKGGEGCRIESLLDWQTTGRWSGSSAFQRLLSHYHRLWSDAMTSCPKRHSLRVSAVICPVVLLWVAFSRTKPEHQSTEFRHFKKPITELSTSPGWGTPAWGSPAFKSLL